MLRPRTKNLWMPTLAIGLAVCASAVARDVEAAPAQPAIVDPADAALSPLNRQVQELQRLLAEQQQARAAHRLAEAEAAREAREIQTLKEQPEGVTRDLELQDRLAKAQERARALSQQAAALRQFDGRVVAARQQILRACDGLLGDSRDGLGAVQRLQVLRLRAAQAEALSPPDLPASVLPTPGADAAADDPALLRERADLLRDTADKVRRELTRLSQRGEELARRQRMRERAAAVDEDLFAEQVSTRRGGSARVKGTAELADTRGATDAPTAGGAPVPPAQPTANSSTTSAATRSAFDPATLDLLRKGELSGDPETRLRALRRAQGELQRLYEQLGRRATTLEHRADELSRQK